MPDSSQETSNAWSVDDLLFPFNGFDVVCSVDISCLMHVHGIMQRDPAMKHIRAMHIAEVLAAKDNGP